jgi:viologen exporter family transport system permease protein
MNRYLKLIAIYYRSALLAEMEYRINFVTSLVYSVLWAFWIVGGVTIFYYHRPSLGGWSYDQILMVMGLFVVFNGVIDAVLRPNIIRLTEHIRKGTMDFVLIKPANSQFLATVTAISVFKCLDLIIGFGLVGYGLYRVGHWPTTMESVLFLLMMLSGLIIVYSLWLFLATLAFWFVKIENFTELFYTFYEAGRFPITVYRGWIRAVLTFVVPVAFLTTFPAATLMGRLSHWYSVGSFGVAALLLYLSSRFWQFAIRFYSSASS